MERKKKKKENYVSFACLGILTLFIMQGSIKWRELRNSENQGGTGVPIDSVDFCLKPQEEFISLSCIFPPSKA